MFCFSSSFLTLQNLPDLICTLKIIDIAPDRVNYVYTIKNIGTGNANLDGPTNAQSDNLSIQGYFSKDEVYDASDIPAGGTIIGTSPLGLLKPQTIRTSSTAASKPNPSFYPQTKDMNLKTLIKAYPFIIVKIDNGNNVPEINESNNYATVRIELPTLVTTVAPDIQYNDKIIVQFDKKVYKMTDLVGIKCLLPPNIITSKDESFVLVTSLESKDVEKFDLKLVSPTTASSLQYEIVQKIHLSTKSSKPHDGTFTVKNGESIYVFFVPNKKENTKALITADYLFDVSLIESTAPVENAVIKKLALSKDELQPMSDGKINGTLLTEKGLPIQVAANELIIYPLNQEQLSRFLEKTKGNVISKYDFSSAGPNDVIKSSYLVRVSLKDIEEKNLSQLRKAMGLNDKIYGSNPEVLKLTTLAVQSLLEGYFVGLNIRLLNMSDDTYNYRAKEDTEPRETSQLGSDHIGANFTHPNFNIPAVWAYMALWDKDIKSIPMAFLDQGYTSPQPDYPHINECSIGIINDCGVGKAVGKPTIGASLFGAFVWHGTGTVTVAAGKINNNFGGAGTGAQVVYPHLYKLGGVSDYAFQIGAGIKTAVDNGASIINFSGGYPCAIQTNILGWGMGICNPADRLASCLLIAESAHIAADITCAASAGIPIVGGIICGTAQFVAWTATSTCAPLIGLRDLKVEMEDGVNYALNRGITVVASAGNRISDLPAGIKEIIENKKMTVENWQIIPAIIPGVICVGAANITQNEEFAGDRVDIWAPVHSPYYAPPVGGEMGDISKYIYDDFDASSCSAPYISGLIADAQSINPNLNPLNPNLTNEQRKKIPNTINNLLRSTAYTKASWPTIPSFNGWIDSDNEVTRLVNPIRFIKSASQGIIPDFTIKGICRYQ